MAGIVDLLSRRLAEIPRNLVGHFLVSCTRARPTADEQHPIRRRHAENALAPGYRLILSGPVSRSDPREGSFAESALPASAPVDEGIAGARRTKGPDLRWSRSRSVARCQASLDAHPAQPIYLCLRSLAVWSHVIPLFFFRHGPGDRTARPIDIWPSVVDARELNGLSTFIMVTAGHVSAG